MSEQERLAKLIISTPPTRLKAVGRAIGKTYTTASTIADHLLANGVIVPPCKIGTPIYRVCSPRGTYHKPWVRKFTLTWKTLKSTIEDFGKTVFLSYEEAERVANGRKEAD